MHLIRPRKIAFALVIAVALAGLGVLLLPAVSATPSVEKRADAEALSLRPTGDVERGRYLVTVGGCNDCHTPWIMKEHGPGPDWSRLLSGHPQDLVMPQPPTLGDSPWGWVGAVTNTAYAGPWGVSYTFNLTPDENTGIGVWTEEMFISTIRNGRHWGTARPILPPMPWENYREMTDDDLKAIYAYLRSIPPIHNRVPEPIIAGADPVE